MGKNKEVSCKICFKSMRSNNIIRHMKVHIIYTDEVQPENNEQMRRELLDEMLDKVFVQREESTKKKI